MDKNDCIKMITSNKLNRLAELASLRNLIHYEYQGRYLLEYLLVSGIHNEEMDNKASIDLLWACLYLKYSILEPLVNAHLNTLLKMCYDTFYNKNRLLLDVVLEKINDKQKMELYHNMLKNYYWLYRINETVILQIFKKHNINISPIFIPFPEIIDEDIKTNKEFQLLLCKLRIAYEKPDDITMKVVMAELKRKYQIDKERTTYDVINLIEAVKRNRTTTIAIPEYDHTIKDVGMYGIDSYILLINRFYRNTFSHELSHLFYNQFEQNFNHDEYYEYSDLRKVVETKEVIDKISEYLDDFHKRFHYMRDRFEELYEAKVKTIYKTKENYYQKIVDDVERRGALHYLAKTIRHEVKEVLGKDIGNITDPMLIVKKMIELEKYYYIDILLRNYYREELALENLLDALLQGKIFENELSEECLSGHDREDFMNSTDLSLNEVLADFDEIKSSCKSQYIINKLRSIVGDELVDFLEDYIEMYRNNILTKEDGKIKSFNSYFDACNDADGIKYRR